MRTNFQSEFSRLFNSFMGLSSVAASAKAQKRSAEAAEERIGIEKRKLDLAEERNAIAKEKLAMNKANKEQKSQGEKEKNDLAERKVTVRERSQTLAETKYQDKQKAKAEAQKQPKPTKEEKQQAKADAAALKALEDAYKRKEASRDAAAMMKARKLGSFFDEDEVGQVIKGPGYFEMEAEEVK